VSSPVTEARPGEKVETDRAYVAFADKGNIPYHTCCAITSRHAALILCIIILLTGVEMCYYERFDFSCGDHKWGNMKLRCELEYRMGETCGMAPKPLDGYIYRQQEQCRFCKDMGPKKRRIEKAESDIKRWQQDDPWKWRANIEKAQNDVALLQRQLVELNNKRTSVLRRL
jgi:hypothetical protein